MFYSLTELIEKIHLGEESTAVSSITPTVGFLTRVTLFLQ